MNESPYTAIDFSPICIKVPLLKILDSPRVASWTPGSPDSWPNFEESPNKTLNPEP